jgi:hypothetical protein
MEIKNILILCGGLLATTVVLTACSNDKSYDFPGDANSRIYFDKSTTVVEGAIVNTPVGYIADLAAKFSVRCNASKSSATTVNLKIDNNLIDAYNTVNNTSYKAIPDGMVTLDKTSLTIPADSVKSKDSVSINIPESAYASLNDKGGYLIPVVISSAEGSNVAPSTNSGVKYLHIAITSSSIKKNAPSSDIKGTLLTDYAGWTGTSDTGDPSTFDLMFSNDGWSGWSFNASPSTFVLDMQKNRDLAGFRIEALYAQYGEIFSKIAIQISTDGKTYTDLGKLTSDDMANENGYQIVCLYGAMNCRYLKLTVKWSADSWGTDDCQIIGFGAYVK